MMELNRFQKGSGCFICQDCGKKTRQTERNNVNTEFCSDCIRKQEEENAIADGKR